MAWLKTWIALRPCCRRWWGLLLMCLAVTHAQGEERLPVRAVYIPLADHYAALVAYEKYADTMRYADFQLRKMKSWDLLRGYFNSEDADMAFVMSPLALDMYAKNPNFRWIGLMHRDGNALAINGLLNRTVQLPENRKERKPDGAVASAIKKHYQMDGTVQIAIPHQYSTHAVVLYKYLKDHQLQLSVQKKNPVEVLAVPVAPPKSPQFINAKSSRGIAAGFEQSLPWADVVESGGYGHIAWYSKDVIKWPKGHVECIAIAKDESIRSKRKAIEEVMSAIHKAGEDIESARRAGGEELAEIIAIVRKHISADTEEAIIASLDPQLNVINYKNLEVDIDGMQVIMDLAVEGKILLQPVDINELADVEKAF